jgi:hypothetical protein
VKAARGLGCGAARKEVSPRLSFALRAPCPVPLVPYVGHLIPQTAELGAEDLSALAVVLVRTLLAL